MRPLWKGPVCGRFQKNRHQRIFNFAIAINTFFHKIVDPSDIAPSMAMGFTINHIAAVVLPAVGGLLWIVDYRIPFIAGAALSIISLLLVQGITGQLAAADTRNAAAITATMR